MVPGMRACRVVALLVAGSMFSFTDPGFDGALGMPVSARGDARPNSGPGRSSTVCLPQAVRAKATKVKAAIVIGFT